MKFTETKQYVLFQTEGKTDISSTTRMFTVCVGGFNSYGEAVKKASELPSGSEFFITEGIILKTNGTHY